MFIHPFKFKQPHAIYICARVSVHVCSHKPGRRGGVGMRGIPREGTLVGAGSVRGKDKASRKKGRSWWLKQKVCEDGRK